MALRFIFWPTIAELACGDEYFTWGKCDPVGKRAFAARGLECRSAAGSHFDHADEGRRCLAGQAFTHNLFADESCVDQGFAQPPALGAGVLGDSINLDIQFRMSV